jgi:hypothetical protein
LGIRGEQCVQEQFALFFFSKRRFSLGFLIPDQCIERHTARVVLREEAVHVGLDARLRTFQH